MGLRTRTIAAQVANSFSNATNVQTLTPTANVTFEQVSSNTLSVNTITSSGLTTSLNTAYSNATSYADTKAATAFSNAASRADAAYTNAVAYAASNTYVNTQLNLKANLTGATFSGAVSGITTLSAGDVTISGNLVVNGNTVTVNTSQINVTDSLMYLASNNTSTDSLDIGFAAHYNSGAGANGHTGLVRSSVSKKYYLFQNYQPEFLANNTLDYSNNATGIQMADLVVGNLVANSTLTVTGATTLSNTIAVTGNATFSNTITITGAATFSNTTAHTGVATFSSNLTFGTTTITANGGVGSAGQVLTSGATGNVYWSTVATTLDAVLGIGNTTTKALTTGTLTVNGAIKTTGAFIENATAITADYSISANSNAMTAGPISIANTATITIPSDSNWIIL